MPSPKGRTTTEEEAWYLAAIVTNGDVSLRRLESERPNLVETWEAGIRDARRAAGVVARLRALLNQLFEALHPTKRSGLDMELSITPSILLGHGGRLWAAPNASYGTSFQFFPPAER